MKQTFEWPAPVHRNINTHTKRAKLCKKKVTQDTSLKAKGVVPCNEAALRPMPSICFQPYKTILKSCTPVGRRTQPVEVILEFSLNGRDESWRPPWWWQHTDQCVTYVVPVLHRKHKTVTVSHANISFRKTHLRNRSPRSITRTRHPTPSQFISSFSLPRCGCHLPHNPDAFCAKALLRHQTVPVRFLRISSAASASFPTPCLRS